MIINRETHNRIKYDIELLSNRIGIWERKLDDWLDESPNPPNLDITLDFDKWQKAKDRYDMDMSHWKDVWKHHGEKIKEIKRQIGTIKKRKKSYYQLWLEDIIDPVSLPSDGWRSSDARLFTIERDNSTCQFCGLIMNSAEYSIHVHHINPESNRSKDLMTFCCICHPGKMGKEFWKLYRKVKKTGRTPFFEFINDSMNKNKI